MTEIQYTEDSDYVIQNKSAILKKYNDIFALYSIETVKRFTYGEIKIINAKIYHDDPVIEIKRYDSKRKSFHHSWTFQVVENDPSSNKLQASTVKARTLLQMILNK